jgi:phosphoserine aminotransferase
MTKNGKLIEGIFKGATINTPSMLCVADYLDALDWVKALGGVNGSIKKSQNNLAVIENFVSKTDWINFLSESSDIRSNTSICLKLNAKPEQVKSIVALLADEGVAFDIGAYRDAPAGLRIWGGATVESSDIEALLPWLEWAYTQVTSE